MNIDPSEAIALVTKKLKGISEPFAFLGGAIVGFLVDNPALTQFRPTKDVDVIVQVVS